MKHNSTPQLLTSLLLALVLTACASVNIQTGPPTDEESTQLAEERGSRLRAQWSNRLQQASSIEQASLLRSLIDSTAGRYLRYGERVAEMWDEESKRAGQEMPVEEVRRAIDVSNETEWPVFEAHEDIIEYGLKLVLDSRELSVNLEDLLREHRDYYLQVFSAVFYPNGTRREFEDSLYRLRIEGEDLSEEIAREIQTY